MDFSAAFLAIALHLAHLQAPRISETTLVMDYAPSVSTPRAVTTLGRDALTATPAATVDDALRSVPGFSLFRRSSSRVANPTTQGATLRGLAASGSSRALVLADGIPLNDPVGGWVYWNRLAAAALDDASVARGASGDLHGMDAVGGVVSLHTATYPTVRVLAETGSDETTKLSAYGGRAFGDARVFGSAEGFTTDGFVIVAPETRGAIDTAAGSRHASASAGLWGASRRLLAVRASHFRESRKNGTPFQRNSTRVTVASADLAGRDWRLRPYAQVQQYEQTFSAVLAGRANERPTSEQNVGATAFGAYADVLRFPKFADISFGARHVSADLEETEFTTAGVRLPSTSVGPSQASLSVSAQRRWDLSSLSAGAGARVEIWQSSHEGTNRYVFITPRLWLSHRGPAGLNLNVAIQTGARGPTLNELYRPFRVGNTITQANALLKPESVAGIEAGISRYHPRTTVRLLGFLSRVEDAIVNVTLSTGPTIVRQRQNAARINARGFELETETRIGDPLSETLILTTATSYTRSDFATGPLEGLRVPQVPRWHHALGARGVLGRARWSAEWRYIDEQFDDDRNLFALDPSSMLDARVGWMVTRKVEVFGAIENVLDEEQDVGRTPIRTIGLPRTSRVGLRLVF